MKSRKQTLVITGSSGFVGEKLAIRADAEGFDVIGIDIKKSMNLDCKQLELDLIRQDFYDKIPSESTIIHLASLSTDSMCRENPTLAIDANLRASSLVLENAKKSNAAHILFASSEWVYPELPEVTEQRESDHLDLADLNSLYAMTKLFGESLIRSTSLVPYTILRFGIVYGERSVPQSAIESLVKKAVDGEVSEVGSSKTARRFIYVEDLCEGIFKVIKNDDKSDKIYNLAGKELVSLEMIFRIAEKILGSKHLIESSEKSPSIRNPISYKFYNHYSWEPQTSIENGINKLIKFYKNNRRESVQ
jgi:nucleoside-diphosphate-sugar epimerase